MPHEFSWKTCHINAPSRVRLVFRPRCSPGKTATPEKSEIAYRSPRGWGRAWGLGLGLKELLPDIASVKLNPFLLLELYFAMPYAKQLILCKSWTANTVVQERECSMHVGRCINSCLFPL